MEIGTIGAGDFAQAFVGVDVVWIERRLFIAEHLRCVELDGRGLDSSPTWREMVDQTMRQGLVAVPQPLYRARYPEIKTLDRYYGPPEGSPIKGALFTGVPPENNVVACNICVGKWLNVYWHASPQMLRLENNLTEGDPRFVESPSDKSSAKSFALRPDSPAWKLGFQKIPVEQIGPRIGIRPEDAEVK